MVGNTGRTADTRRIRRLRQPRALEVEAAGDGTPLRMRIGGGWQDVTPARRPWYVDQHWWRGEALRRVYYDVVPEDGPPMTIYRDRESGAWARQQYQ